jgi:hypothetical protein
VSLFRAPKQQKAVTPDYTGLQIQTAVSALPIPIVWGQSKLAPNVIWYNNFQTHSQGGGGGGKGLFHDNGSAASYTYSAAVIMALCEGPITGINQIWRGQSIYTLSSLGLSLFTGTTPQSTWSYLATAYPSQALAYQGTAFLCAANYDLSSSATLDNHNFEVQGFFYGTGANGVDADPAKIIGDFLGNAQYGAGFSTSSIDLTTLYGTGGDASLQTYCKAAGIALSPALTNQETAAGILGRWLRLCNTAAVWSGGLLRFIPYGDGVLIGGGVTFRPNVTPLYDLSDDDFKADGNADPLQVSRSDPYRAYNVWRLEVAERNNAYNLTTIESRDQNAIELYGARIASTVTAHEICDPNVGLIAGQLMLQRAVYIRNTYKFRLSWEYCLLDPMDLVTVTDGPLGLNKAPVRILDIEEDENGFLEVTAEEFPAGAATATLYATQTITNNPLNRNVAAGPVNAPIIFEPTDELGRGLQIWAAVSSNTPYWGGAYVWASYAEDGSYAAIGTIDGPARMGATTADLPPVAVNATGRTIDQANTLSVDIGESGGTLATGTTADALALNTACYVGGEIVAYANAALTAAGKYDLTYLVRGAFGTESNIVDHPAGTPFLRLDGALFKYGYDQSRIGSTIYLKFQSFNVWGGGVQDISDCPAYPYTITGSALASPLPNVVRLYSNYEAGFQKIYWDEISDFRSGIVYEIRQGATWASAALIRTQAHPPFIAQGNGTFWVSARCQPTPGLTVYSETPSQIVISGNQLSLNLLAGFDERATGWSGTFDPGIGVAGPPFGPGGADIRLGGAGTILAESPILESLVTNAATASGNVLHFASVPAGIVAGLAVNDTTHPGVIPSGTTVLSTASTTVALTNAVSGAGVSSGDTIVFCDPDVLSYGGIITGTPCYYTIPASHIINAGSPVQAAVNGSTQIIGVPVGQNILALSNILSYPDVLGAALTQYVDGWIEINVSPDGATWSGWQKFVPGVYPGIAWNFRLALVSFAGNVIPFAAAFNYAVQIPARIDHYQNLAVPSTGLTITFARDAAPSVPAPFNGGPGANQLPYWNVSWQAQAGDTYTITGLSLSRLTIQFFNGGSPVARTGVNVDVEGF